MMTDLHAKYIAHELTRRCASDSVEKLTAVLSELFTVRWRAA
jgi:hypothetical protein